VRKKEKRIRRRERREQKDEEFRLPELRGLSPPAISEYSLSDEEEEKERDEGQAPPERWEPAPPLTESCGGGGGTSAWGGRGSARRRAVYGRGGTRCGGTWRHDGGGISRGLSACRALEKEETGLLHPEVGHCSYRHSVSRGVSLIFSISHSQGDADYAPPRSHQGVEVGCGRPHEAALIEGAAGGRECGDSDEQGRAQPGHSGGAAVGGGGSDGSHDHSGHRAVDSSGADPGRRQSGGGGGDPGRGHPAARMGPVGEPARTSPRAPNGGACGEG
jgi:hypothetical protein